MYDTKLGGSGKGRVVAVIAFVVTVVAAAASVVSATLIHSAIFALAASVVYFTFRTDLSPVVAMVAVSTVSSCAVAFACRLCRSK